MNNVGVVEVASFAGVTVGAGRLIVAAVAGLKARVPGREAASYGRL